MPAPGTATDSKASAGAIEARPCPASRLARTIVAGWSVWGLLVRLTILVLTGLTWSVRSAQEVLFQPDYWDPSTLADYFAVYAFSAAWLLTSVSLVVFREVVRPVPKVSTAILVVALACCVAGVSNAIEDGLGAKWLGVVYASGALTGALGMFVIGGLVWTSFSRPLSLVPLACGVTMVLFTTAAGVLILVPWLGLAIFIVMARTAPIEDIDPSPADA